MKIIRFTGFKFIQSKYDGKEYLRMIFTGYDGSPKFLAFAVNRTTGYSGSEDIIAEDFRNYIRAQCMLNEASMEVRNDGKGS